MAISSLIAKTIAKYTGDIFDNNYVNNQIKKAVGSFEEAAEMDDELSEYVALKTTAYFDEKLDMSMTEIREKFPQFLDDKNNLKGSREFSIARGYTEEQMETFEKANQLQDIIDPDGSIMAQIQTNLEDIRDGAVKFTANATENDVLPRKAKPLVDYFAREFLHPKNGTEAARNLSKKGLERVARNLVIDALKEEDTKDITNLILRELPKERADVDDLEPLLPDVRERALEDFLKGSTEQYSVFRAVSSYNNLDYDIGFAMPREIGVHVGTMGQSNAVAARAILPEGSAEFTLPGRGYSPVEEGEFGEFFEEKAQEFLAPNIDAPPITMIEGYIRIKNPLRIDIDMPSWDAGVILTGPGKNDFIQAIARQNNGKVEFKDELEDLEDFAFSIISKPEPFMKGSYLDKYKRRLLGFELNKRFQTWLMKNGFDSIQYRNMLEPSMVGEDDYSYILFKPQQFKSVTAKRFDPKAPRDMRNRGGLVHPENKKFFEDFHNRVVSEGRELVEDDKTTTMRIMGVGIGGKEYLIPSYDPDTKRVLSMDEAVEKYMPLIKEGKIKGYDTPQQAEADRKAFYPEIINRDKKADGGYVIKSGDTLSQIAKDNNTTVAEIARLNGIEDVNKIYAGQKLNLGQQVEEAMRPEPKKAPEKAPEPEKEDEGFNLNVDFAKQFVRGFFKTGDQETEDFSDKLVGVLKDAARNAARKGQEYITYKEYPQLASGESADDWVQGKRSGSFLDKVRGIFTDPVLNAAVTVGQGNLVRENGRVYFTDEYDFTPIEKDYSELGAYGKVRKWAGENFPEEGNQIRIDLGPEEEIFGRPEVAMDQQDADTQEV